MPPPGTPSEELLIARFRSHARRLFWSALVLIATFGATGYFFGNLPWIKQNLSVVIVGIIAVSLLPVFIGWLQHRRA